ncbi:unannotated protein [freshwater metagenome]|uniref:Unannotated protein n=1 Tax=freshwater metagenome TaxID=449393 RepID=A0A6J7HJY4_9ZZZZ
MAELHLVRAATQCPPEDLVAEADAEQRQLSFEYLPCQRDTRVCRGRVSRAVGQEHTVRVQFENLLDAGVRRHHVHADTALGEHSWSVGLDAEIDCHDGESSVAGRFDGVPGTGGHLAGEIRAEHGLLTGHLLEHLFRGAKGVAREHSRPHRTARTQVPNQGTRVDSGDADDVLRLELVLQRSGRAPARRPARWISNDVTGDPDLVGILGTGRLAVLLVPAGVTDLRSRGHHDLAVVARIGQRLLVSGHTGAEDGFAERASLGPERGAAERPAVLQNKNCAAHAVSSLVSPVKPSVHTG